MSQDFTKDLIWAELEKYAKKQIDSGLSNDEIQAKIEAIGTGKVVTTVIEQISNDCISSIYENMYERVMAERNKTAKFIIHNEQLWQSGFVTSEMMYLIVIESAEAYCKIFDELTEWPKTGTTISLYCVERTSWSCMPGIFRNIVFAEIWIC